MYKRQTPENTNLAQLLEPKEELSDYTTPENTNLAQLVEPKKELTDSVATEKTIVAQELEPKEELTDSKIQLKISTAFDQSIVILFDYEKHFIPTAAKIELNALSSFMTEHPTVRFLIKGHTDSNGPVAYNQKLSLSRANQVYHYLITKGISKNRLEAKGYGFSQPFAPNFLKDKSDNPAGRKLNRRVEFELLK